jgi:hypothetical protein
MRSLLKTSSVWYQTRRIYQPLMKQSVCFQPVVAVFYYQAQNKEENAWKKEMFYQRVIYPINYQAKTEASYSLRSVESTPDSMKYIFDVHPEFALEFETKLQQVISNINDKWVSQKL